MQNNTDTLGYAASEATSAGTQPQLVITLQAGASGMPSATASATPTTGASGTPTATASATASTTPTAGTSSTATATASATPTAGASSTRIKDSTFESGSLTDPTTGVDRIIGAVTLESSQPLQGRYAARIANAGSAYLQEAFSAAGNLFVSFLLRLNGLPSADERIVLISNSGTTIGNLYLRPSGALRLRNGTATIGADTAPLLVGKLYRVGLRQSSGNGSNAILQAYLAADGGAFGTAFASLATGDWQTPADRVRVGATISTLLDAVVDDMRIDTGAMP